jgi:hypothetical protein
LLIGNFALFHDELVGDLKEVFAFGEGLKLGLYFFKLMFFFRFGGIKIKELIYECSELVCKFWNIGLILHVTDMKVEDRGLSQIINIIRNQQ